MTDPNTPRKRRGLKIAAFAIAAVAVVGGALASAHGGMWRHGSGAEAMEMHLDHVQSMLTKIGASDAQKTQIEGIFKGAMTEMQGAHEQHFAALKQIHEALLAPTVDRARVEELRAGQIRALDQESQRLMTALDDAADILTPEQRASLAREIDAHHHGG
jgi:periplasmic protein CpxP/Spy